jgi:hypothetical protein
MTSAASRLTLSCLIATDAMVLPQKAAAQKSQFIKRFQWFASRATGATME